MVVMTLGFNSLLAQKPNSAPSEAFSYEMVSGDGTNASAVAWDSKSGNYVTVIAGNAEFPMETFDARGNAVGQATAGFDWRGFWYNASTGKFEGNGAGDYGWVTFSMDNNHQPSSIKTIHEGQYQPDFQSVGCYDDAKKQVVFLDFAVDGLSMYSRKNPKKVKALNLNWSNADLGDMNITTVGYTGHKNYEFVLLDINNGKLVFFNRSGEQTAASQLPSGIPLNDAFAFSFANNHAFVYDVEGRVWHAYKMW